LISSFKIKLELTLTFCFVQFSKFNVFAARFKRL
jgi:hypothetical protein